MYILYLFLTIQKLKAENADEEYIAYPQISAGDNFILALRANGDLYAWGDNTYGQLGLGLGRCRQYRYETTET